MNLRDVELFTVLAETCNLSQAARRLGMSAMSVSRHLAQLEKDLGARLFQRTTRAVSLTSEGEEFLPYARTMIEAEQGARIMFSEDAGGATGLLKITAPSGIGRRYILPLLPALMERNARMKIDLNLSDDVVDIVGQGYDVAIRVAPLRDSNLIAHRLSSNPRVLCASPAYLSQHGIPGTFAELANHQCLRTAMVSQWTFEKDGIQLSHLFEPRFVCNNVEGVRSMCKAGAGLAQLTKADVYAELAAGELVEITLIDAEPHMLAIWALFPTKRYLPSRVTVFLDALKSSLKDLMS
ncbi:LysR family transcriptional regulator [Kosakonia cowanii]|uniref:LysR family transcriptional regulator n=1 Tax=Kosakonia cowanii TaxID=208223 RepID=UPI000B9710B3|nr:LysR family transcriptional regulator [Kosakonia cowanii]AST71480.1 LysR family transcriptional regulator [Kosakonia cowanii]